MCQVFTARLPHRGPDGLDITRSAGSVFGPSWALLQPLLAERAAQGLGELAWSRYRLRYLEEQRALYRRDRRVFEEILRRPRVVALCHCRDPARCHRTLWAIEVLQPLGVIYCGEWSDQLPLI